MPKKIDIQELAENWIKTKSNKDFNQLYKRLKPGLWTYVGSFESDFEEREALINLIFAKAIKAVDQYSSDKGKFSTWIYRIAFNEALTEKSRKNKHVSLDSLQEEGFPVKDEGHEAEVDKFDLEFGREREVVFSELYDKTVNAFAQCKDELISKAFIKWHFEKKPYEQIGKELGICTNTAKQKIFKGKHIVKDMLLQSDPNLVQCYRDNF